MISPRSASPSSPILPGRWGMDCNRNVKLLFRNFFRMSGRFRRSLSLGPNFRKCYMTAKWIYL